MYNEISVCVNDIEDCPESTLAACQFAAQHQGRVTAVYVRPEPAEIVRWQGTSPIDISNQMLVDLEQREQRARQRFLEICDTYFCEKEWRTILSSEHPYHHMLYADVIFAAQPSTDHPEYPNNQRFLNNLILQSKRPVLMIPRGWEYDPKFAENIILGWNASAESMRAASDALPFFQSCSMLTILDVVHHSSLEQASSNIDQLESYLNHKNVAHTLAIEACNYKREAPKKFLSRAQSESAGLIVVGGYGHSRLREAVMGGMTDYLIKQSNIPTLFSH